MRRITILTVLLLAALLLFSACNDTTITTEPESAPAPSASEEYAPDLTLARQVFDKLQANEGGVFATDQCYSLSDYQVNPGVLRVIRVGWSDCFAYDNTGDPVFPSRVQAEQIVKGLLINEVYDLLGRPHYNTYTNPAVVAFCDTDIYTMYVLDDGNVLLLGYSSLLLENYTKDELVRRVGEDHTIEEIIVRYNGWRVLTSIQMLSIEELAEMEMGKWQAERYQTAEEYLPKTITKESAEQVRTQVYTKGLTYGQIKKLVGSGGISQGELSFRWKVDDGGLDTTLFVGFEESQDEFDDMVAINASVETAYWD